LGLQLIGKLNRYFSSLHQPVSLPA